MPAEIQTAPIYHHQTARRRHAKQRGPAATWETPGAAHSARKAEGTTGRKAPFIGEAWIRDEWCGAGLAARFVILDLYALNASWIAYHGVRAIRASWARTPARQATRAVYCGRWWFGRAVCAMRTTWSTCIFPGSLERENTRTVRSSKFCGYSCPT